MEALTEYRTIPPTGSEPSERLSLVSVVTPFYNTADFLAECIESVLRQSYQNWEYVLVNNCSTDGSAEIAEKYARQDPRIHLYSNDSLLSQVENYNHALSLISTQSKYCKMVEADNWLFPECLEKMVKLADCHADVGVVAAYYLKGTAVAGGGGSPEVEVYQGREVCRKKLLTASFYTGSPTAVMYRADSVRSRQPFYPVGRFHEDSDVVYEILEQHSLGFVPQILCFQRIDNPSILTKAKSFGPGVLNRFLEVEMYADRFLTPREALRVRRDARGQYFAFMGRGAIRMREHAFWQYHFRGLKTIGWKPPYFRIAVAAVWQTVELILNPLDTIRRVIPFLIQ